MLSRKSKYLLLKLVSLFSVIRGYNILVIILAQYISSIFIFANKDSIKSILLDYSLLLLVLATSLSIAAGYIINNFYDSEKDLINKPRKSKLDRLISQQTKLSVYFVLNFITLILASYVSFKSVVFFSSYIFLIWFYSHKLKKYPFIGNMVASALAITPIFIVFVYYRNFEHVIFVHGLFLLLIISMREITKDLENLKGDLIHNYRTIPVSYGIRFTKRLLTILTVMTLFPIVLLIIRYDIGRMDFYFFIAIILLSIYVIKLWYANQKASYLLLHNLLKFMIVFGVFSIILIRWPLNY